MLDIGWAEMLLIGIVALIVVGPEDLPHMFRQLGRFTAKIKSMGREFSRAMEDAAKESGVKDVAKDLKTMTSAKAMGLDAVKSAVDGFEKWDPIKASGTSAKPLTPPPMPANPKPAAVEAPPIEAAPPIPEATKVAKARAPRKKKSPSEAEPS
jgi:sec-independent protein translocase protein TatB